MLAYINIAEHAMHTKSDYFEDVIIMLPQLLKLLIVSYNKTGHFQRGNPSAVEGPREFALQMLL